MKQVSLKVAKRLQDLHFYEPCKKCYAINNDATTALIDFDEVSDAHESIINAPTIAQVQIWLEENRGVTVLVRPQDDYYYGQYIIGDVVKEVGHDNGVASMSGYEYCLNATIGVVVSELRNLKQLKP